MVQGGFIRPANPLLLGCFGWQIALFYNDLHER